MDKDIIDLSDDSTLDLVLNQENVIKSGQA